MRCILAIDNGGSKCEAVLARDDGSVLGWGICRVPGLNGRTARATQEAVRVAMGAARTEIRELHLACLGANVAEGLFGADEPFAVRVQVMGEHDGPLSLVNQEHGIVVLSGTGAFVHAELPDGRRLRLDGLGPLLGDCGSGYQIGYLAMRAAMRSSWHPRRQTALAEAIAAAFRATDLSDLIELNFTNPDRCVVASLANEVDRLAADGDAVARRIMEEAAAALAETLRDAIETLDLAGAALPMVGTGSVAKRSAIFWNHFCGLAAQFAPGLKPMLEPMPSAAGMALAMLRQLPDVDRVAARENLFVSADQFLKRMEKQCL